MNPPTDIIKRLVTSFFLCTILGLFLLFFFFFVTTHSSTFIFDEMCVALLNMTSECTESLV